MASRDQQTVMLGNLWQGNKRKRSIPGNSGPGASVEPMPLAMAPPSNTLVYPALVYPAENRIPPSTGLVSADGLQKKSRNSFLSEDSASGGGGEHMLVVHDSHRQTESQINMETGNTAREAQRQMRQFTSTFMELCTGYDTSQKKIEELGKQVAKLERERDEAREEARKAVNEKRRLELKLEKETKQYKTGLRSFVANLAKGEGKSLGDYVNELVKETPCNNRAPADRPGHEGNVKEVGTSLKRRTP